MIADSLQHALGHLAEHRFIINKENTLTANRDDFEGLGLQQRMVDRQGRQGDMKNGAFAELAVAADKTAVALDYAVYYGQAHTGTFADFFGGKKGVENFVANLRGDSLSGVADGDMDKIPRR